MRWLASRSSGTLPAFGRTGDSEERGDGEGVSRRDVRIVIGEGGSSRRGLLRFVLEGEGFEVVGEADQQVDLVHVVALLKPDVVVLDDGIGVAAVGMVREIAPQARVVLVWPQAVVPVGGDARVEPAHVVQDLGPAVERVAAALIGPATETFRRPDWVDRVRKDPAALRELLTRASGGATAGINVSQLQRRIADAARREREAAESAPAAEEPVVQDAEGAAVLILPAADGADTGATGSEAAERERARRIGTIALGAAAVSAALVFALALGGSRIPVLVLGEGPRPSAGPPSPPVISPPPDGPTGGANGNGDGGGKDGGGNGGGQDQQVYGPAPTEPTVGPGDGDTSVGGGGGSSGGGGDGGTGGGGDGGTGGGTGGGGDGGTGVDGLEFPGKSALHNPYGGPPGILSFTPKPWMFLDEVPGFAGEHGRASGHEHAKHRPGSRGVDEGRTRPRGAASSTPGGGGNGTGGHRRAPAWQGSSDPGGGGGTTSTHGGGSSGGGGSGPPAHAGTPGPPPHAGGSGPPAHAHKH